MNYLFHLQKIKDFYNDQNDINDAQFINQLDIKKNLYNYLSLKLFRKLYEYAYFIELEKQYDYQKNNYMYWTLSDICNIFFNIKIKEDIIPLKDINMDYLESNIFGSTFSNEYIKKLKNTLLSVNTDKFLLVKDFMGDIHIILKADALQQYNISSLYINGVYLLLTNENNIPFILEKWESKTCLNDLKEE